MPAANTPPSAEARFARFRDRHNPVQPHAAQPGRPAAVSPNNLSHVRMVQPMARRDTRQPRSGIRPFPVRVPWLKQGAALLLLGGLIPASPVHAASGSGQQAHDTAGAGTAAQQAQDTAGKSAGTRQAQGENHRAGQQKAGTHAGQNQANAPSSQQPTGRQAKVRAEAIGRTGTVAPVGLPPGPRGTGATSENPTPHAGPGERIVPGTGEPRRPVEPDPHNRHGSAHRQSRGYRFGRRRTRAQRCALPRHWRNGGNRSGHETEPPGTPSAAAPASRRFRPRLQPGRSRSCRQVRANGQQLGGRQSAGLQSGPGARRRQERITPHDAPSTR